jgi:OOP family OmpA-OmpF porin
MSKSKTLWSILLVAWISGSAYWHVCKIKQLCDDPITGGTNSVPVMTVAPLIITDSTTLKLESNGNFSFAKSGTSPNTSSVKHEIDSLVSYLNYHKNKQIAITGQYSSAESNSNSLPDLGMARAQSVKDLLIAKGIADSLVHIQSSLNENLTFVNDSLTGGIDFSFKNIAPTIKPLASSETELANEQKFENIFKPLDLYFPTASSEYIKTDQNQMFINAAKKFLAENRDKKLVLTGHTDDEDSAEWNLALSKKRANVVRKQFILMGISAGRIITKGKGEWEPKASNATPQGKRANRRVTIVVQ